ncbi:MULTISPECIES: Maf-like protein [unclassified Cellulophaga]|uniref:Maf-like protein n=1 Tax=unclassified Cellulophaga TaxID=2634405 RepID=UPI000C2C688B|nr:MULTISPECIES: Maf-like protein [unclassified Cellulophaga]MDO6490924.1 Maf-like protein [Cellulophaga sp. 2_MG-2023]MDO6493882.1 Maf-like protein [Cellulophaga sp. 3_MG-2023]PKB44110.1 septum formation protein [Cellulophaga sp. RHA19]
MLSEKLKDYNIILASGSPRRHQFFKELDINFKVDVRPIEEVFPNHLQAEEITDYLAALKAEPFKKSLQEKDILITSDTIVWHNNEQLGKPKSTADAIAMLTKLSNSWHQVATSVCFTSKNKQITESHITKVKFKELSLDEITYYVENYKPLDKAGAYGIQEWIGLIAIEEIIGSYPNVVGLPTHLVYKTLLTIANA